jgi:hypothetical protein
MKTIAPLLLLALASAVGPGCKSSQPALKASPKRFENHVVWLADDARGGRGTGTEGLEAAARYISEFFETAGLQPLGHDGFLQRFEATGSRALGEGNTLSLGDVAFDLETEWIPFASTATGDASGALVFAGYGIRDLEGGYDDYAGLDVTGKIVLVLRGGPGASSRVGMDAEEMPASRYLDAAGPARRLIDFTSKINTAFKEGALGILVVNDPASYPAGSEKDVPMTYGSTRSGGVGASLPAVHLSAGAAQAVLGPLGLDLAAMQRRIDERMEPSSFDPGVHGGAGPEWTVAVSVVAERALVSTFNVVGMLPGLELDEYVVVGAHMDHLGNGLSSGSLSGAEGRGMIHNGADDNASGTAGLLEVVRLLSRRKQPLRRSVVFIAFGAEEWGLLGSHYFVENPPQPVDEDELIAMVNMDMIGRSEGGFLSVEGLGTSPGFTSLVTTAHVRIGKPFTKLALSNGVPPNSDQAPFAAAGIPIISLFTGLHDDYHRPSDDSDLVNPVAGAQIASLASELVLALAQMPERPLFTNPERGLVPGKSTQPDNPHAAQQEQDEGPSPRGYSVWFGSQPDMTYTQDDGLRVTGTTAGSPAQKCGLLPGDVIVSLDGKTVRNIQDYAVLLFSHQPGEVIKVGVSRDGEILELTATLEAKSGDS